MRTCLYCSGRSSVRCKAGEQQPSGDLLLRRGSCQWRRCSRRLQFLRHVGMPDYFLLPQQRLRHLHPHPWAVPWRRHRWASLTPSNTSLTVSCCWVEWIKKKIIYSHFFFFFLCTSCIFPPSLLIYILFFLSFFFSPYFFCLKFFFLSSHLSSFVFLSFHPCVPRSCVLSFFLYYCLISSPSF